jgi:hypothetical protein
VVSRSKNATIFFDCGFAWGVGSSISWKLFIGCLDFLNSLKMLGRECLRDAKVYQWIKRVIRVVWQSACFTLWICAFSAPSVDVTDHVHNGFIDFDGVDVSVTNDQVR